jgi:hypothetical protein
LSILAALDDLDLFRGVIRTPPTFAAWRAFLAALFGLPMTEEQFAIYRQCTVLGAERRFALASLQNAASSPRKQQTV